MAVTGILGGAFDPPHIGHLGLARAATERFGLDRLLVTVVERPGHRSTAASPEDRLALAQLAFEDVPGAVVEAEPEAYTVDALERRGLDDPIFLIGADQFAAFPTWRRPERVLELARLGVATRPGYPRQTLGTVIATLERPERVLLFELESIDVSATDIRERVSLGKPIDGLVPPTVAAAIERLALYRGPDAASAPIGVRP